MDLNLLVDQFLDERLELGHMSVRLAARYRIQLIGDTSTPYYNIGYVLFLNALGIEHPSINELNGHYIGRYWEFLTEHFGTLRSESAMRVLRHFWKWCAVGNHVSTKLPPDLKVNKVTRRFKVTVKLEEEK